MNKNDLFRGAFFRSGVTLEFAQDSQGVEFNGKTYMPTSTLAYFTFVMCHSLPTVNSHNFGVTPRTLAASHKSAIGQLLNIRHLLAINDAKGRLSEDRIVGNIVDVFLPIEEWQAAGKLDENLNPTEKMNQGMPLYALGSLFKRAKGISRIIAEHKANAEMWATSVEMLFPWHDASFMVNGKMVAAIDAPPELFEGVRVAWENSELPKFRYQGNPVYLIGGGDEGSAVTIAGCALTTYPADSGADILRMAASLEPLEDDDETGEMVAEARSKLPDSAFAYVERTGKKEDGRTVPDSARHCPIYTSGGGVDVPRLRNALARFNQVEAVTNTISTRELRLKLVRKLLPLAKKHFPDGDFVKKYGETKAKGGESMTLLELLKAAKESLEELQQTDGFQAYKEAGGKASAAATSLFAAMDKCDKEVAALAEVRAKVLAEESVKEGYITKENHEKALAEAKAESEKAVEKAKGEWEAAQKEKDAQATVIAERMEKLRGQKVDKVPDSLREAIANMSTDEEGVKAFDQIISRLGDRRKACESAGVALSEQVESHILSTLIKPDEDFNGTLELWKSLSTGSSNASHDHKGPRFIPDQKSSEAQKKAVGVC